MDLVKVTWGAPSFWIERFPLYFGIEKGLFQKRGVRPQVEVFHGGPELLQAVRDAEVHVGEIGLPPFIKAFSKGLAARIIGSTFIRQLDHFLAVRPDIRTVADLKGKRIGILSCGSCDDYFLRYLLQAEGIDPDADVEILSLGCGYGDVECFSSGATDACFMVEPSLSLAESKGHCSILVRIGDLFPRYQWGGIFASDKFIQEHRSMLMSLMDGYRESVQQIASNPKDCIAVGSRIFRVEPEVFRCALNRYLPNSEIEARIDLEGLENCIRIQRELGAIPEIISASEMVLQM